MTPVNDRELFEGQVVQVYRNLNRDCFSIRDKKTRLVVGYCMSVTLTNARFVVSAPGHARVIKTGIRTVHAYVEGEFISAENDKKDYYDIGYYNPFKTEKFIQENTGKLLEFASFAHCQGTRVYFLP